MAYRYSCNTHARQCTQKLFPDKLQWGYTVLNKHGFLNWLYISWLGAHWIVFTRFIECYYLNWIFYCSKKVLVANDYHYQKVFLGRASATGGTPVRIHVLLHRLGKFECQPLLIYRCVHTYGLFHVKHLGVAYSRYIQIIFILCIDKGWILCKTIYIIYMIHKYVFKKTLILHITVHIYVFS